MRLGKASNDRRNVVSRIAWLLDDAPDCHSGFCVREKFSHYQYVSPTPWCSNTAAGPAMCSWPRSGICSCPPSMNVSRM